MGGCGERPFRWQTRRRTRPYGGGTLLSCCSWKGKATYWNVAAGDIVATDAAFAYDRPWPLARRLVTVRVEFW
ncbi:MAG: DUF427 domain-containing protein [Acidimicrobiales bacterium]